MPERELTLPEGAVRGGVVPLHPASDGSRRQFLFEHLAETLVPRGVAVLRFDRRPSPDGQDIPFAVQADDALAALRALRAKIGDAPLGLWAWSQGAWAASLAAASSPEVAFLVLLAACGVSPAEQMRYGTAEQLRRHGFGVESLKELREVRAALEDAYRDPDRRDEAQAVVDRYADRPWFELAYVPRTLAELDEEGEGTTLRMRTTSLDWVASLLAGLGCSFRVRRPDELRASVQALAQRLARC